VGAVERRDRNQIEQREYQIEHDAHEHHALQQEERLDTGWNQLTQQAKADDHQGAQRKQQQVGRDPGQRHDDVAASPAAAAAAARTEGTGALSDQIEHLERDAIIKALEQTRYNKTAAAKLLGVTYRALRYKIQKLEIE
jgi:transcriptional regulator with GAF, ATPase, and Fis domain